MYLISIDNKRGISLMEVLTTVVIISILSSTAYVGWRKYIRRAITTEAKVSLSMVFASQTQYKATCNIYHPDLRTIGALPKGKLYYNVGVTGPFNYDINPSDNHLPSPPNIEPDKWGHCLTEEDDDCTNCVTYFDEICCSQADFEDVNNDCPCYIREKYKLSNVDIGNATPLSHTPLTYCGMSKGIFNNKFCILAFTAINRNKTDSSQWDVWAVNHLNIIKQVYSPGD